MDNKPMCPASSFLPGVATLDEIFITQSYNFAGLAAVRNVKELFFTISGCIFHRKYLGIIYFCKPKLYFKGIIYCRILTK